MGQPESMVAVVGCGLWGSNHVRVFAELGALGLVCDEDRLRAESAAETAGVAWTTDFDMVLESETVGAVIIATPAVTHHELALKVLRSGKDALVEKPMALNSADASEIVAEGARYKRVVAVGHVLEYHPAILRLRQLIEEGALGRLRYIYANRLNFGRIRSEESALWSFAPHDIAVMNRLVGSLPRSVGSRGGSFINRDIADVTVTTLSYASGVSGHIHVSWLHPYKDHKLVVIGDRQMAVFDDTRPWDEKLRLYPHEVAWLEGHVPVARAAEAVNVPLEAAEPLTLECIDFLECIQTRRNPLADGVSGLRVMEVLEAAQTSLDSDGGVVRVGIPADYYVHPSAIVDRGAVIGSRTRIWHFSHVMPKAVIGADCVLGQNVFVGNGAVVGDRVKIQNGSSVFDGVELEDEVFCGPSVTFTNVINPRSDIERKDEFRKTIVRRGATVGANATVVCGVTIGEYAMVGAGAVVTKDVPAHGLVVGVPATRVRWACTCGVTLSPDGAEFRCSRCGRSFREEDPDTLTEL